MRKLSPPFAFVMAGFTALFFVFSPAVEAGKCDRLLFHLARFFPGDGEILAEGTTWLKAWRELDENADIELNQAEPLFSTSATLVEDWLKEREFLEDSFKIEGLVWMDQVFQRRRPDENIEVQLLPEFGKRTTNGRFYSYNSGATSYEDVTIISVLFQKYNSPHTVRKSWMDLMRAFFAFELSKKIPYATEVDYLERAASRKDKSNASFIQWEATDAKKKMLEPRFWAAIFLMEFQIQSRFPKKETNGRALHSLWTSFQEEMAKPYPSTRIISSIFRLAQSELKDPALEGSAIRKAALDWLRKA